MSHTQLPLTTYPQPSRAVRAWVHFGADTIRVNAKLARSTALTAGIEFYEEERVFRCWVWGNAVTVDDDD